MFDPSRNIAKIFKKLNTVLQLSNINMSSNSSNNFGRTNASCQNQAKSNSTKDTALKTEYKEYTFETNHNKNIQTKVAAFWKELGDRKPPKIDFYKTPEISDYECLEATDYGLLEEEEDPVSHRMKYKWTNTYCLFKKRGCKETAAAGVPKKCPICNNDKFAPQYADEKCLEMVKDYANEDEILPF